MARLLDAWARNDGAEPRAVERLVGPGAAALVGLVRVLDLDHVGAEERELVGRKGTGEHVGDVDHPDAVEGPNLVVLKHVHTCS